MSVGNPLGACFSGRCWGHTHPRRLGTSAPVDEKVAVKEKHRGEDKRGHEFNVC